MELQECIDNRRSIRRFLNKPVPKDFIIEMIKAAGKAPSWKNSQVSRYYVAENLRDKIYECLPGFNQGSTENAPIYIVTTIVKNRSGFERDGSYSSHLKDGFQYFDNGLQVQNLCLKAHELGLGTLIMGLYDVFKVREILEIPAEQEIVSIIAVGYPDIEPVMPPRKAIEDICIFK